MGEGKIRVNRRGVEIQSRIKKKGIPGGGERRKRATEPEKKTHTSRVETVRKPGDRKRDTDIEIEREKCRERDTEK